MPADDMIRASDGDREHTVAVLRAGYTAGRLTLAEFDDRITAAFTSRTWGELRRLTWDLPSWPGPAGSPRGTRAGSAPPGGTGGQAPLAPGATPVLLLALYWLGLSVAAHAADVLIPAVLVLLMVVWSVARLRRAR
jgi:Domain of unknown function (DUF1707)